MEKSRKIRIYRGLELLNTLCNQSQGIYIISARKLTMAILLLYATIRLYYKIIKLTLYIISPWLCFLLLLEDLLAINRMANVNVLSWSLVQGINRVAQQMEKKKLLSQLSQKQRWKYNTNIGKSLRPIKCEMNGETFFIEKNLQM